MVGGRWSVVGVTVVGGRWSVVGVTVVGGLWSVGGRWFCTTPLLAYLYGRLQSTRSRPDVMPERREGIMRAADFGVAHVDTQAGQ